MSLLLLLREPSNPFPDVTPPEPPTGVAALFPVLWSVPLAFALPDPVGPETVTATMRKNGAVVATGVAGSPYVFAGVADGDQLSVRAVDNSGHESADVTVVFDSTEVEDVTAQAIIDAVLAGIAAAHGNGSYERNTEPLDAAAVRGAVGLAEPDLDDQLAALPAASAAAVLAAAEADPIAAHTKKINNVTLQGNGTSGNPMRPA